MFDMASFTRPEDMAKVKGNCLIRSIGKGDVKSFWSLFDMAKVKGELLTAGLQSVWSSIRKKIL